MKTPPGDLKLARGDPKYPPSLDRIQTPPSLLYMRGTLEHADILAVAIVGSRNPTPYGRHIARTLAGDLARAGMTIVSGLARGIDTEAHKASLAAGGRTLAVLGCGLDIDYPRNSDDLKSMIAENGALLTEFPPGTPPLPQNFPSRNRIISGLSLGVVVVEAGSKSGSLITARWALDQGREVMAVPGRADSPLSEGPIALIREGAPPICGAVDVLRVLGVDLHPEGPDTETLEDPVLASLRGGPRLPEEISRSTRLPLPKVLSELSRLMIDGYTAMDEAGAFFLK
jgi:DNA processing protein